MSTQSAQATKWSLERIGKENLKFIQTIKHQYRRCWINLYELDENSLVVVRMYFNAPEQKIINVESRSQWQRTIENKVKVIH